MNNNNPPFAIGEEVVRTGPSNAYVTKGQHYIIDDCFQCPVCGEWHVTIVGLDVDPRSSRISCATCLTRIKLVKNRGGLAKNFRRLSFVSDEVSQELAQQAVGYVEDENGVNVVPAKETVASE